MWIVVIFDVLRKTFRIRKLVNLMNLNSVEYDEFMVWRLWLLYPAKQILLMGNKTCK